MSAPGEEITSSEAGRAPVGDSDAAADGGRTLRVVIVEDSPTQRAHLVRVLEAEGDVRVVGLAGDAREAADVVARERPDMLTLDIDLPAGGGQAAIEEIMDRTPTPILVVSGVISGEHATSAIDAIAAGAVEVVPKPERWTDADAAVLRRHVRRVGAVAVIGRRRRRTPEAPDRPVPAPRLGTSTGRVVAIAASTGGPPAVATVVGALAGTGAFVLLVQHIHPTFADSFVDWLGDAVGMPTQLGVHGRRPQPGEVHVAPPHVHMRLAADGTLRLSDQPPVVHRPSGDELLRSVAESFGPRAVGVVLTGMGEDGARGLLAIRELGGRTFAQDRASSVVWGMPGAAQRLGAVDVVLPPARIGPAVRAAVGGAVAGGDGGRG